MRIVFLLACALSVIIAVTAMSDTYGHNPQHEFGSVFGGHANPLIPFWHMEGDAYANQDFVRLVPDRQSKRGGIWNTEPNKFANWEATFAIHIHGSGQLGADGLAFWYSRETSRLDGGFFGFTDQFAGLGIVLDTYDNDNSGLHPLLVAIVNNGHKKYTHQHHAEEEGGSATNMEVGNCQMHARNLQGTTFVRVTYRNRQLKVEHQIYGTSSFAQCLVANNIDLPVGYHFGFTAATGHQADDHDLYGFSLRNLDASAQQMDSQRIYSSYDKYQIAEHLAKIAYAVDQSFLDSSMPGSGNGGATAFNTELSTRITNLEASIKSLEAVVRENVGKVGGGGNMLPFTQELATIKTTVAQMLSKLGGGDQQQQQQQQTQPPQQQYNQQQQQTQPPSMWAQQQNPVLTGASSSWWSTLFYVFIGLILLGGGVIGFSFWRKKKERSKKYF